MRPLKQPPPELGGDFCLPKVIRMTGFMKGLYTDAEMKSDNVKDKDAKISFLQKAIDVVVMVSGEPLLAKPARIVAGHEPERTNELLQMMGKCCLSKLSSDDAVKKVLAGEKGDARGRAVRTSKSHELDNKNAREEESRMQKDKEERRHSEVKERSTSREEKQKEEPKEESRPRERERDKLKAKENDRERHKEPWRDKHREGERDKARARARPEKERDRDRGPRDREAERERRNEGGRERDRDREQDRDKARDRERQRARDPDRDKSRELDRPGRKPAGSGEMSKKLLDGPVKDSKVEAEVEVSNRASRSLASKTSKQQSTNSVEGDSASDAEGEAGPGPGPPATEKSEVAENLEVPSERPSSARLPRPGSARPAPPRVKRQESVEASVIDRTGSGKTVSNVIRESQISDDEEDEHFVVEAAPPLSEMSDVEMVPAVELEGDEKHGGLVKKILETKKDYEKLQQVPRPGEKEKSLVFESAWKKEKDIVCKEIEKLRISIQSLCRSTLPLGKIMDYLQEDVDAMQHELQLWHSENRQHAEALQKEQSVTDSAVEPLMAELAELEQQVRDQQDKICAVKANILRNEEKIQKMVYSINLTSRQ
ncbi:TRAF3-interacting protein 1 isoform X2 [Octodon degus]|uniref:TRAF3-interacting protein 1 n=1 Tax=Octodon degus TaxID=10160 RepID=A0A6P6F0J1_OCTDE|nr:TRAF3-interacting protein 1 isoform X2 [Octodon degus]